MDSVVVLSPSAPRVCGPSSRNQVHIVSVIEAPEETFVDNNLSVGDADVIASAGNKVTGAAVFTSCTVLGCDRGHPEEHWTSTPPSWSLVSLARYTCTRAHTGSAPPTGTKRHRPDLEPANDELCADIGGSHSFRIMLIFIL